MRWGARLGAIGLTLCLTAAACADDSAGPEPGRNSSSDTSTASNPSPRQTGFEADVAAIQEETDTLVGGGTVPGIVVLARDGAEVHEAASGVAVLARQESMTPAHVLRIGSITKPMVAVLVLKLVERGVLSLEDDVERWLPELLPSGNAITIEQLLSHSSGLADYLDSPRFPADLSQKPMSPRQLVGLGAAELAAFPPGQGAEYSNTGYIVLGMIIERATGRSLASNLQREVFAPVGMDSTGFGHAAAVSKAAHGYESGEDVTDLQLGWVWAAGAAVSNVHDVASFFTQLISGRLVPQHLLARMEDVGAPMPEVGVSGYGLGLAEVDTQCGTAWGHEGQLPGFVSAAWLNPKTDRQVVVLANGSVDAPALAFQKLINKALCGS
ncbi:MAG: serine hydrolase domain-containing protein [Jiangellaceae bacterium]